MHPRILLPLVLGITLANSALAASPDYMMEDCKSSAQVFFQDYEARTDVKYEGQRRRHPCRQRHHLPGNPQRRLPVLL
jgi:hypothetical protein